MNTHRLLSFVLVLAALFIFPKDAGAKASAKPNVIIIFADDLGWGDLGCYGQKKYTTPHLDRMAAEGARLTDFYSAAPFCAPSRAALLTGRYQFRSGMTQNPAPDEPNRSGFGIPQDEVMLGELFQKAGYRTACVGKWHLGHTPEYYPQRHGFHEYLGILYSNDMRPVQILNGTNVVEYPVIQANLTKKYTARALQFVEKNKSRPFFLYLPHAMPHKPLAASEDFYKKSGAGLYGDVIQELDWGVGEVFRKLKQLKLDEKTLVFFTSDNGAWYGGDNGGLRGMKSTTWEGGIRVPLLAWWPGKISPGHVSRQPAIMMDLFVTSLVAAGIQPPQDRVLDGRDILPLLTGNAPSPHEFLFSMRGDELKTIRSGKWKLHGSPPGPGGKFKPMSPDEKWVDKRGPDGVTIIAQYEQGHPSDYPGVYTGDDGKVGALFDLESDPAEQHDVSGKYPEVANKLKARFDQMNQEVKTELARRKGTQ